MLSVENLKEEVYKLYNPNTKLSLDEYNNLISLCVNNFEMSAVIFIYDHMKDNKIVPSTETYNLIDKLHSKTIQESNEIYIKNQDIGKLKPRRRIHKIMKGYNYSDNYNKALVNVDKVKNYIEINPTVIEYPRIKLAKDISKNCSISFDDARYIITNLKKTKYFSEKKKYIAPIKIDDFSKILEINKKSSTPKQTSITNFFQKKN